MRTRKGQVLDWNAPKRGFFGIGIYHPKRQINVGTLWRSANVFGASFTFSVGHRFEMQHSDCTNAAMHIPHFEYNEIGSIKPLLPYSTQLIGVEIDDRAVPLETFQHPSKAMYILGAEDHGLPEYILNDCHHIVQIPGKYCLNVAVAGSILMYDRIQKMQE